MTLYTWPFEPDVDVTREFGPIIYPLPTFEPHEGIDFRKERGTLVKAMGAGTVALVMHDTDESGYAVWIKHDDYRVTSVYAHLDSEPLVAQDERIEAGQVLGYVGSSGTALGVHLHLEVLIRGQAWNPRQFFKHYSEEGLPSDF